MADRDQRGRVERLPFVPLLQGYGRAFRTGMTNTAFRALSFLLVTLIFAGTVAFHFVEGWSWLDSMYFCVVTLATVGYGDFHPVTALGKVIDMAYIVVGLGVLVGFARELLRYLVADLQEHPLRPGLRRRGASGTHPPPDEPSRNT
jgi:hypothetical protein